MNSKIHKKKTQIPWVGGISELATATDTAIILYMWRPAGRKTRVGTLTKDNCVSGGTIANFLDGGFLK